MGLGGETGAALRAATLGAVVLRVSVLVTTLLPLGVTDDGLKLQFAS